MDVNWAFSDDDTNYRWRPQEPVDEGIDTFTPCFDWVVRLTGSAGMALTYGVIWRYCQLRHGYCFASQPRLAKHLGRSERTIIRHLHRLQELGLIELLPEQTPGWTLRLRAVPRDQVPPNPRPVAAQKAAPPKAAAPVPVRSPRPAPPPPAAAPRPVVLPPIAPSPADGAEGPVQHVWKHRRYPGRRP